MILSVLWYNALQLMVFMGGDVVEMSFEGTLRSN